MGNEDDNPTKTCWIQFLSPICLLVSSNAEVLVVVVVVGCAGLMITGLHFQLLFTLPPSDTDCSKGYENNFQEPGGCFTNVSRALQDILLNFVHCRNRSSYENFKLKLWTCAQSMALGTRTKFQLEILTINVISSIVYFREIILESLRNVSETTPCAIIQIKYVLPKLCHLPQYSYGSRDPTNRVLGFASNPGLGTRDPYSYWGRWHSMATHT